MSHKKHLLLNAPLNTLTWATFSEEPGSLPSIIFPFSDWVGTHNKLLSSLVCSHSSFLENLKAPYGWLNPLNIWVIMFSTQVFQVMSHNSSFFKILRYGLIITSVVVIHVSWINRFTGSASFVTLLKQEVWVFCSGYPQSSFFITFCYQVGAPFLFIFKLTPQDIGTAK